MINTDRHKYIVSGRRNRCRTGNGGVGNRMRSLRPWFASAGALALLAVAACTPGGDDDEGDGGGELVWAIGGAEAQPGGVHQSVVALWNEQNPETPVRIEILPDQADQQREQQTLQLDAEESTFDILGMDVIWTGEYSENGWLESLEDIRGEIEAAALPGPLEAASCGPRRTIPTRDSSTTAPTWWTLHQRPGTRCAARPRRSARTRASAASSARVPSMRASS
jgi:ABC-type glycerol-3-phosphate transport system substrate-binding protein